MVASTDISREKPSEKRQLIPCQDGIFWTLCGGVACISGTCQRTSWEDLQHQDSHWPLLLALMIAWRNMLGVINKCLVDIESERAVVGGLQVRLH